MKGAIGNAFILNMVITFILIFFSLLIGSMAFSKAFKVKNYILNSVVSYDAALSTTWQEFRTNNPSQNNSRSYETLLTAYMSNFDIMYDSELRDFGYILANDKHCPTKDNYEIIRDTAPGAYDYCIYLHYEGVDDGKIVAKYNYMVLTYMKFDFPVVGNFLKLSFAGESKTIVVFK